MSDRDLPRADGPMRFFLTGRVCLLTDFVVIDESDLPGMQGRLALTMLLLERRPLAREVLTEWLWPASNSDASKLLPPVLSKLRAQLARLDHDGLVLRTLSGSYQISLPSDTWIDVEDAITRLDRAEGALRRGDFKSAWADATAAVSVLRRGLLPGCDGEWVEERRRDLSSRLFRGWVVLAEVWLEDGDTNQARSAARSAINLDRFREDGYRLLVRAEMASGNRAAARHAAVECERMLRDELGVAPSAMTRELFGTISS